jgi:hypothetical protein
MSWYHAADTPFTAAMDDDPCATKTKPQSDMIPPYLRRKHRQKRYGALPSATDCIAPFFLKFILTVIIMVHEEGRALKNDISSLHLAFPTDSRRAVGREMAGFTSTRGISISASQNFSTYYFFIHQFILF